VEDNKYDRLAGRMELLGCLTKINAFIASENLTQLATHDPRRADDEGDL
jgi:hypothetical protein